MYRAPMFVEPKLLIEHLILIINQLHQQSVRSSPNAQRAHKNKMAKSTIEHKDAGNKPPQAGGSNTPDTMLSGKEGYMKKVDLRKLATHEDPYHLHKTLGILSLLHFIYRYFVAFPMNGE